MIFYEDLAEHKDILDQLDWSLSSCECLSGIEGNMLWSIIKLKQENNQLRKDVNKLMRELQKLKA